MTQFPIIRKIGLFLLGMMFMVFTSMAQTYIQVEDLDIAAAQQTYGAPVKNRSVVGEEISVGGEKFNKGIGVHSNSNLKLKLNNSRNFTAKIGVNDCSIDYTSESVKSIPLTDGKRMFYEVTESSKQFIGVEGENGGVDKGSVIFKLLHNGKEIYNSGIIRQGEQVKEIDIPIIAILLLFAAINFWFIPV